MRILVTGGAGFIGSHLVDLLIQKGFRVAVLDNLASARKKKLNQKAVFFQEDILSPKISRIFAKFKPEIVNHHAALVNIAASWQNPEMDLRINVRGTLNILEMAKKIKTKQFIFASSVAVYGDCKKLPSTENQSLSPISVYGVSKATAEFYVKLYKNDLVTTILRYANVYGPRQDAKAEGDVVAIFINNLKKKKRCSIFGSGRQTRDFIFVEDIARANYQAIKLLQSGIYNIATTSETSILELYRLLKDLTGSKSKPQFLKKREGDIYRSVLDNKKAKKFLNWQPRVNLKTGLKLALDDFS